MFNPLQIQIGLGNVPDRPSCQSQSSFSLEKNLLKVASVFRCLRVVVFLVLPFNLFVVFPFLLKFLAFFPVFIFIDLLVVVFSFLLKFLLFYFFLFRRFSISSRISGCSSFPSSRRFLRSSFSYCLRFSSIVFD